MKSWRKKQKTAVNYTLEKNNNDIKIKIGNNTGKLYFTTYPKKLGHSTPFCSAIDFTIKFGPLPMYVINPKKTAASYRVPATRSAACEG